MQARRRIQSVWQALGEDRWLWGILAAILVAQLPALLFPQSPVSPSQRAIFARWLAEQRATLGPQTDFLVQSGLLFFRSSLWMRAIVAGMALVTAARVGQLSEKWGDLAPRQRWLRALTALGGALVVMGWGVQMLWGWSEPGIVAWPGQPLVLPEHHRVLPLRHGSEQWRGGYGLYLIPQGYSVGLEVQATDQQGASQTLQSSTKGEPQATLKLALTPHEPEAFFALPVEGLILRLRLQPQTNPADILVQAYRSASGDLITESTLVPQAALSLNGASLHVTRYELPNFDVVYNPGAPLTVAGVLLGVGGMVLPRLARREKPAHHKETLPDTSAGESPDPQEENTA